MVSHKWADADGANPPPRRQSMALGFGLAVVMWLALLARPAFAYQGIAVFDAFSTTKLTVLGVGGTFTSLKWNAFEPTKGAYQWSQIDNALSALQPGQVMWLGVSGGANTPSWVYSDGAQSVQWEDSQASCAPKTVAIPWDPVYLNDEIAVIQAIGARYGLTPQITAVGGLGLNTKTGETHIISPGACAAANAAMWVANGYTEAVARQTFKTIADAWHAAWPNYGQPFSFIWGTIGTGFPNSAGTGIEAAVSGHYGQAEVDFDTDEPWQSSNMVQFDAIGPNGAPTFTTTPSGYPMVYQELKPLTSFTDVHNELQKAQAVVPTPLVIQMYQSSIAADTLDVENLYFGNPI